MYCPKCGALNPNSARLCSACGQVMMMAVPQAPDSAPMGRRVSGWAIAALVLGILSPFTCMLTTLPAIVAGIVALVKIRNSHGRSRGTGMAVAGMVLAVALLLGVGIMMPARARSRQSASRASCRRNLRDLQIALWDYAIDHRDRFPTPSKWCDLLVENVDVSRTSFRCHRAGEGPSDYAMNKSVEGLDTSVPPPPNMVLLYETHPGWNQAGGPELLTVENHQGDGCNILFADGHIEFVRLSGLSQLRWTSDDALGNRPPPEGLGPTQQR